MKYFLFLLLLLNLFIGYKSYITLFQRRKLYSERYAMIVAMSASFILAFITSLLLSFLVEFTLPYVVMVSTVFGILVGVAFGAFVKFHSVLAGVFHGVVGGMMGAMLGAVVKDPTLCGLPADAAANLVLNTTSISLFGTSLLILTFWFINYSLRV